MSYSQIAPWERYAIAALLAHGYNQAQIAWILDRHRSTISRELRRNVARTYGWYHPKLANDYARTRRWRTRQHSQYSAAQWRQVVRLLEGWLSPEQISGYLRRLGLFSICHETIYRYVRADKREGGTLYLNLRQGHRRRRKRYEPRGPRPAHPFKRHIDERPRSAQRRVVIGHWEIDTMAGPDPSGPCLLTLVERTTGYVALGLLRTRTAAEVNARAIELLRAQPRRVLSITADNGSEFAGFTTIEQATGVPFYFTNPYHAWERGTNENTNGLIRQFIPKGQSLANLTQHDCTAIARALNRRPRKRLRYRTPEACYVPTL
jgi:transposase, IS30 family